MWTSRREEEGEKARKFALQLKLLEGSRARLRTRQNELRAQEKEILEELEPTHGQQAGMMFGYATVHMD